MAKTWGVWDYLFADIACEEHKAYEGIAFEERILT
jgi:hypothetical protein